MLDEDYISNDEDESPPKAATKSNSRSNILTKASRKSGKTSQEMPIQQPLDDLELDEETQSVITSVGKIKQLSELESKISRLRSTVGQLKQQYDIYKTFKELLENAKHGNLFNEKELKPLDDIYRKEKENLFKKIEWSLELVKDLKAIYEKKQKLIVGLARAGALPKTVIKQWEESLQTSDHEIVKHTQYALHFQALFPKK